MALFSSIFLNNVLPAFLIIGVGVLLDRLLKVDKKSLSRVAIYVLVPGLVFTSATQSKVDTSAMGQMILFVLVLTILLVFVSLAVGAFLRWPQRTIDALVLSVAFVNAGNLGLSIILFSYGDPGLDLGAAFFVATNVLGNSLAAFFALRGKNKGWRALLEILKLPGPYAFAAALLLRGLHAEMPTPIWRAISLIGQAAVPVMLMMLGVQLSQTRLGGRYTQVAVGVMLRLVVGALIAIGLAPLMGLQGLARNVAIVQAATPTAVTSGLMAIEFDADADYVASVIFVSTLLSGLTITALLSWIG
jgi:predicted permease